MSMTITAKVHYRPNGHSFVKEQPSMEKPEKEKYYGRERSTDMDSYDMESYNRDLKKYSDHLASLRQFDYPTCTPSEDGRVGEFEIIDGVAYQLRGFTITPAIAHPQEKEDGGGTNFEKILKETPLETRLRVSNEMSFISLLTELGYREDKHWTPDEDELLSKLCKCAKEHTEHQLEQIKQCEQDGRPNPTPSEPGINPTQAEKFEQDFKELNIYIDDMLLQEKTGEPKDAGNLQIAFTDKFNAFRTKVLSLAGAAASQQGEVELLEFVADTFGIDILSADDREGDKKWKHWGEKITSVDLLKLSRSSR